MPDNQMVVYAHWRIKTVTVTYVDYTETEDEIVLNTVTKNINSKFRDFNLTPQEKQGYAFVEWRNADTDERIDGGTTISTNIKVKAKYKSLVSKPVYYDLNGAALVGSGTPIEGTTLTDGRYKDNDTYVLGASVPAKQLNTSKVTAPEGTVSFVYWNTEANGSGKIYYPDEVIDLPEDEDTVLYAIWAPKMTTTLTYDLNYTGKPEDSDKSVLLNDYRALQENALKVNDNYTVGTEYNATSKAYEKILYSIGDKTVTAGGFRPGYILLGWDESKTAVDNPMYKDDDLIRATSYKAEDGTYLETQTLFAHWKKDEFPVEAYEIVKGNENTAPTEGYSGNFSTTTAPTVYNCGATDSNRFDTAYLPTIDKESFPEGTKYAYAKIGGAKILKIQYVAITNTHGHITGYEWQYLTDAEDAEWTPFVKNGANKTIVKLYYSKESIEVPIRYLNRAADGTLTEISADDWNIPTEEDDLKAEIGTTATSYGKSAGDTKTFAQEITSKVENKSYLKLHYVGTGIGSTGSTIALENDVDPAADYFLQNSVDGVKHADSSDGLDEEDVAVKTGDFAIYVVYEEQPAYIKISNNSTSKNFTFRLTIAGGSYTDDIRTDGGTATASEGHYDFTINSATYKVVYIPYGAGLAYEVKLFKGSTEVTDPSDESVEWVTGEGYDPATGTLEAGTLLGPSDTVTTPTLGYKHVAIKDVEKHGLTVTNTIEGEYADMTRKFPVTITLTKKNASATIDQSEVPVVTKPEGATEPAFTLSADGKSAVMTVDLGQNENVEIPAIPADWKYTISEGDHDGYDLTFKTGEEGDWTEVAPSGVTIGVSNVSVTLKNYFDSEQIVPSGIAKSNMILIPLFLSLILALGIVLSIIQRRRLASRTR